jgi:hypothetical protein
MEDTKKGHFILIKVAVHQEEITIVNLHVPNIGASNFIKHTLLDLKTQVDPNTVVVGDFSTPLSPTDKNYQQRNSRIEWYHRSNGPDRHLQSYFILYQHDIHSSQQPMEPSLILPS